MNPDAFVSLARRIGPAGPITVATVVLFAVSPLVVGGSLGEGPLATMFPFAAILAVAAVGQTLVIQQGGVDFSVPGTVSLSAVVLTKYADQDSGRIAVALLLVAAISILIGLANAFFVTRMRVTPIIATLGVNALVLGAMRRYSGGLSVPPAPEPMRDLATGKTLGIHNPLIGAAIVVLIAAVVVKRTVIGRRFETAGSSPVAARLAGVNVGRHQASAYVMASLCYAVAGIMLASFLSAPRIDSGEPYLLSSIAATVIGGTSLAGGSGSIVGAFVGALFLTQLSQLLLGSGLDTAVNFVVQGGVIAASMAIRTVSEMVSRSRSRRRALRQVDDDDGGSMSPTPGPALVGGTS